MHYDWWQKSDFSSALAKLRIYEVELWSGKCIIY